MSNAVAIADARANRVGHQLYAGRARAIIERSLIALRSSTWVPVATGFVEPVLYLLAFGYGMGELIGNVTLGDKTIDYTVFIAPGLLLIYLGGAMGVNIWLLKGFVDSIPVELDEAAKMDGASPMQTFWLIFLPLAAPVLAVVALLSFIGTFNEFIVARLFLVDVESRTVAVGLQQFVGAQYGQNWGPFAAGSLLASIPIVILFLWLQKYIINGLTAGSTKG